MENSGIHNGIYTMEYYTAEKKGPPTPHDSMDGMESIMLSEGSQVVKDRYHMILPIHGT